MSDSASLPPPSDLTVESPPGRRRAARIWAIVVVLLLAVGGIGIALIAQGGGDTYTPGVTLTSSDGTFSIILPAGWTDATEEFRSGWASSIGGESAIEGFAILDDLPYDETSSFSTMSGHPVTAQRFDTPEGYGQTVVDGWFGYFDGGDPEQGATGTFLTDAGDDVWHTRLTGKVDGEDKSIVFAVVMGDDYLAQIDLELTSEFADAEADFLVALRSLTFSEEAEASTYEDWGIVAPDGRTYSVKGSISMVVPDGWAIQPMSPEISEYLTTEQSVDALPIFEVPGSPDSLSTLDYASVGISAWVRQDITMSPEEALEARLGEVGQNVEDSIGAIETLQAIEPWDGPEGSDSARALVRFDLSPVSGDPEGPFGNSYFYLIFFDDVIVEVYVTAEEGMGFSLDNIEEALRTLRVE